MQGQNFTNELSCQKRFTAAAVVVFMARREGVANSPLLQSNSSGIRIVDYDAHRFTESSILPISGDHTSLDPHDEIVQPSRK